MLTEIIQQIPLSKIRPNPLNPRKRFAGTDFDEFCKNIAKVGVLQPILVRPVAAAAGGQSCGSACEFHKAVAHKKKGVKIPGEFGKCIRPEGLCAKAGSQPCEFEIVFGGRRYAAAVANAQANGGIEGAAIPAQVKELSDDDALDLMTVENLQREDLTPLEEAQGFSIYVDRFGEDSIPDLAERVNLDPRYIRRRLALLKLPPAVLEAWDRGDIQTGHLHQLLRLEDKKMIEEYLQWIINGEYTVGTLKGSIDRQAPPLKWAKFDLNHIGCPGCNRNSSVQKKLFDIDCEEAKCTYPKCFKQNQNNYYLKNWKKTGFYKRYHTTGFRFYEDIEYDKKNHFYDAAPDKCRGCESFVTLIDLDGTAKNYQQSCIGKKDCYEAVTRKAKTASGADKEERDPDKPRVEWHGGYFREKFFQQELPQRIEQLTDEEDTILKKSSWGDKLDLHADRLVLLNLIETNHDLHCWFAIRHNLASEKQMEGYFFLHAERIFKALLEINDPLELRRDIRAAAAQGIVTRQFSEPTRRLVADHIGIDLSSEWTMDEEYLQKKTKDEMLKMGEELGIFADPKAQAYLYETLGKKRGKFASCKAGELRDVFLKSGVELKGKVPAEILAGADHAHDPDPEEDYTDEEDFEDDLDQDFEEHPDDGAERSGIECLNCHTLQPAGTKVCPNCKDVLGDWKCPDCGAMNSQLAGECECGTVYCP